MKCFLHAKIHKAVVTEANLDYVGSITIDKELLETVEMSAGEKVLVTNNTNGNRLETYIIAGKKPREICMNGACAHLMKEGDEIIIMAFQWSPTPIVAKTIVLNAENTIEQKLF